MLGNSSHKMSNFGLFSDFLDAANRDFLSRICISLSIAEGEIKNLNARYGGDRFYLFHHQRTWCETEG